MAESALPHGLRPAVTVPSAATRPGTGTPVAEPAGIDPIAVALLLVIVAIGLVAWWWHRRTSGRQSGAPTDAADWVALSDTLGQPDWYPRLGQCLCQRHGTGLGGNEDVARLLAIATGRDAGGDWAALQRHWEWATYGGYPGRQDDHRSDLATARRGWP
ncbi:MAG: hypothetical protein H7338_03335 [Candidatus Sericytochromatia bacterium]|nr:hypothetical protein [Candidatus Sericytochromatia bacterium]